MRRGWLLVLALGLWSCGGPAFDTTVSASTTVQGSPLGSLLSGLPAMAGFTGFNLSQSQDFANQGVKKEDVQSVKLRSLTLKIKAPNDQDYGFLDTLEFYAEAPGVERKRVAHKSGIASLGLRPPNPVLTMDLDDVELQPYVTASQMSLTTVVTGRQPSRDTTIEATGVFHVVAKVF